MLPYYHFHDQVPERPVVTLELTSVPSTCETSSGEVSHGCPGRCFSEEATSVLKTSLQRAKGSRYPGVQLGAKMTTEQCRLQRVDAFIKRMHQAERCC
mmetsp:Transcript_3962/g.10964  ORF Transcript_3962/g.10964 Transcript_3962/m.10964 type:complete len:98 (-) Transcript_3962:200-493(-)